MKNHPYTFLLDAINNGKPRMHATGLAQLYIMPGVRLHAWSELLFSNAPDVSQIAFYHDHRYGITSYPVLGSLLDSPAEPGAALDYSGEPFSDAAWSMWEVRPAHEGLPEKPHPLGTRHHVILPAPRIVKAGEMYTIPKRAFHATRGIGDTMTIMRKDNEENFWPRLLVPDGFDPVHSLVWQPDVPVMKAEMRRILTKTDDAVLVDAFKRMGL